MDTIPYDKRSGKIWFNNELVDWKDAKVHVLNHGLHYASCVLKEKEFMMEKFLNLKNIQRDFFILQKGWELKCPILKRILTTRPKKL